MVRCPRRFHIALLASALAGLLASARPARASEPEGAAPEEQQLAQALFDEGRKLMASARYDEACPKFAESQRLDPGGGTLLNLALCHEKQGKLATAKLDYDAALAAAIDDGRKDRERIARERREALAPRVPRLRVVVSDRAKASGLDVKLDGVALRPASWGVETEVDPGSHSVSAAAPGRESWSRTVELAPAQRLSVAVPALTPLAPLREEETVGSPTAIVVRAPAHDPAKPRDRVVTTEHANPIFYTVLVATVLAGGASAVTGGLALASRTEAREGCLPDRSYCRDEASSQAADRAGVLAWTSTITLGAAAVGAISLIFIPRSVRERPTVSASIAPGGFSLSGTF